MTESAVVNSWIRQRLVCGAFETKRHDILELLNIKSQGAVSKEVRRLIEQQQTQSLLDDWLRAAARAAT